MMWPRRVIILSVLAAALACGCTPAQYAAQADRAAYGALSEGQRAALGQGRAFDVTYRPFSTSAEAPHGPIHVGPKRIPTGTAPPVTLTLDDCLQIASANARDLQDRKEDLYSQALALASARRSWNVPLLAGSLTGEAERTAVAKGGAANSADAGAELSLTQRMVHGAVLTLAASLDLATDFLGGDSTTVGSLVEANVTQPVLRGAWRELAYEDQYRLERDFLFAVFDYERFTETFAVDVLAEYYSVLQQRDELENEKQNIQRLADTVAVTRVLFRGGHTSRIQLDQAEQNLINAKVRYQQLLQTYQDALDAFKVAIGLPIAARVKLNYPEALKALGKVGPLPIPIKEADAAALAMATRPDVLTRLAGLRDAVRDVEVAADAFLPQLDVTLGISAANRKPRDFYNVRFDRRERSAAVTFNYALDQTDNRDAYRGAMITLARTRREYERFLDESVRLGVRQSYRNLLQSRTTYDLQKQNVELAARRRSLAVTQQRGGAASARDVLEAEEALRNAQNGLTQALISYTTTRLQFLAELGMIRLDERGRIHERNEPFRFDRIGRRYPYVGRPGDGGK